MVFYYGLFVLFFVFLNLFIFWVDCFIIEKEIKSYVDIRNMVSFGLLLMILLIRIFNVILFMCLYMVCVLNYKGDLVC